jgi:hypothetical protein
MPKTEKHDIYIFEVDKDGNISGFVGVGGYTQQEADKWLKENGKSGRFIFAREVCRRIATPETKIKVTDW